jgi:exopolysaccharide biosynthesis polyprenyl glycosylphosphotransferase
LIGVFWVLFYAFFGFYTEIYKKSRTREFLRLCTFTFFGTTIIFFLLLLEIPGVTDYRFYYKIFISYFFIQLILTGFSKSFVITHIKTLIKKKKIRFNTLLIGSNQSAKDIFHEIENGYDALGFRLVAYVHVYEKASHLLEGKLRHLGEYKNIGKVIRRCHIQNVIIAIEPSEHKKITEILNILEDYDVRISILSDIYQLLIGSVKVNYIFGLPLMEINQNLIPIWQKILKRSIDVAIALSVLILGSPVLIIISLITRFTSKGPIFYFQERIGKNGMPFKIIKFRSMFVNAEKTGPALSSRHDPRITNWGRFMRKTRIDEFPQFYNVLAGEMSLVGPRPERQYFIDQIIKVAPHYKHLHKVRPGITSLGQVKFGYAENVNEMVKRLQYDILYIENMSLTMDFRILAYTVLIMIQGRGK